MMIMKMMTMPDNIDGNNNDMDMAYWLFYRAL